MGQIPIVRDELPDEDAFGPHSRLASALADHILSRSSGDTIGLEGDWGSGKSSTLHFLKKELETKAPGSSVYFLFDAWAHEGDELRKSFLDELNQCVTPPNKREKLKDRIWSQQETIKRKSHTSIRLRAILFALSVALIPAFSSLLTILEKDQKYVVTAANITLTNTNTWLLNIVFLGLFLPFIFVGVGLIKAAITARSANTNFRDELRQVFRFVNLDDKQSIDNITVNSSTSFRKFKDDLKEVVSSRDVRVKRIVIAIDNIDRLEPALARRFWSSLAPFFERAKSRNVELQCLTLILPYSRSHLRTIFETTTASEEEEDRKYIQEETDGFIQKSFDLLFEVPPPLLSSWQDFLERTLALVFPAINQDSTELKRISLLFGHSLSHRPTPRKIKQFVNQLATTKAQLLEPDKIPLRVIAAYVLNKPRWLEGHDFSVFRLTIEPEQENFLAHTDYQIDFAAIMFGVSKAEAPIALMEHPIRIALQEENIEELTQLSKLPHFADVATGVTYRAIPSSEQNVLLPAHYIRALATAELATEVPMIWKHLALIFPQTTNWREIEDWASLISATQKHLSKGALKSFNTAIRKKLANIDEEQWDPLFAAKDKRCERWTAAAQTVASMEFKIPIPSKLSFTVYVLANHVTTNRSKENCLWAPKTSSPESDPFEVDRILGLSTYQLVGAAHILHTHGMFQAAWKEVPDIYELFVSSALTSEEVSAYLSLLISHIELENDDATKEVLRKIYSPKVLNSISYPKTSKDRSLFYSAMLVGALYVDTRVFASQVSPPTHLHDAALTAPEEYAELIALVRDYFEIASSPQKLFEIALQLEGSFLTFGLYIYSLILKDAVSITFDIRPLLEDPQNTYAVQKGLSEIPDGDWNGFHRVLSKASNIDEIFATIESTDFSEEHVYLYRLLLRHAGSKRPEFIDYLTSALLNIPATRWCTDFEVGLDYISSLTAVAAKLRTYAPSFSLDNHARDAISAAAENIFSEPASSAEYVPETITALMGALGESARNACHRDVLRLFEKEVTTHSVQHLIHIFGFDAFSTVVISERATTLLHALDCLLRDAAGTDNDLLLAVRDAFAAQPAIYKKAESKTKQAFRRRLLDQTGNADEEYKSILIEIAKCIGIRMPKA